MQTHYQIQEELGRGAMGVVYRAHDPRAGRTVAIKVLKERPDPQTLGRFLQEGQAAARVRHPNVLAVHDLVVPETGPPYLVTDYAPGGSVRELLETRRELTSPEIVTLMRGVCSGVAALHGQGVIHRDLKPDNLLLSAAGSPLVADLGLARALDRETRYTQSGVLTGTPAYMAPEQLSGKAPTPATDVYALGVVLFELLTGRLPFRAANLLEQIRQLLEVPAPRPSAFVATADRRLEAICLRCLEKDPAARYADAAALGAALESWEAGAPASNLRLGAGSLGLLLGLAALGSAIALGGRREEASSSPAPPATQVPSRRVTGSPSAPETERSVVSLTRESFARADMPVKVFRAWGLRLEDGGLDLKAFRGDGAQLLVPFTLRGERCRLRARLRVRYLSVGASYAIRIVPDGQIHSMGRPGGPPLFEAELQARRAEGALEHGWTLRAGQSLGLELDYAERTASGPFEVTLEVEFGEQATAVRGRDPEVRVLPLTLARGDYWLELVPKPLRYLPDDGGRARSRQDPPPAYAELPAAPGYGRILLEELRLEAEGGERVRLREPQGDWAKAGELGRQSALPGADPKAIASGLAELATSRWSLLRNEVSFLRGATLARAEEPDRATQAFRGFFGINTPIEGRRRPRFREGRLTFWADAWPALEPSGQLALARAYDQIFHPKGRSPQQLTQDSIRFRDYHQQGVIESVQSWSPSEALLCLLLARAQGSRVRPISLGTSHLYHGGLEPALEILEGPAKRGSRPEMFFAGVAAYLLRDYRLAKRYWEEVSRKDDLHGKILTNDWRMEWRRVQRLVPD